MWLQCKRIYQALVLGCGVFPYFAVAAKPPPLVAETLTEASLPFPLPTHSVIIYDEAFNNETDARMILFDAEHNRKLGQIDSGYYPNVTVSPDHHSLAVATTYWSRGGHGSRTDVVEFWDLTSLRLVSEIVLPPTRLQGPPTLYHLAYSADQRFLYSHALTPAAAWTIIDLKNNQLVGDIDTDGCVQIIPSQNRQLNGICESGRLLSVTIDETGHEMSRQLSDVFFDDATDPLFVQAIPTEKGVIFLSHHGIVHEVDLSSKTPRFLPTWSMVGTASNKSSDGVAKTWRPGGVQLGAVHVASHRLYVQMHLGIDGSHKDGGQEIWVFDTQTHRQVGRFPIHTNLYGDVVATQVTNDEHPVLVLTSSTAKILTVNANTGAVKHVKEGVGQTPWYVVNP